MKSRILASLVVIGVGFAVGAAINMVAPLYLFPGIAVGQFSNNDQSYVVQQLAFRVVSLAGFIAGVAAGLTLLWIWWTPAKKLLAALLAASLVMVLFATPKANAYYDQTNYTEAYFILPNESAFFIPDVGANKDTQGGFGSEAYLQENKIAAKRFEVPHQKLTGSSYWSNFYVPAGRLIIVDRTPYNREWTAVGHRGTSTKDESFPCQSKEGLNVTAEVGIAVSVREENAARFLYWFGVKPPVGDRSKPETIFTSVFYGRNLAEVMDGVGRGQVQTLVCNEIGKHLLDEVNANYTLIIDQVRVKTEAFLAARGITLDYVGWAGTLTFDANVQHAINEAYAAAKIAPVLDVLKVKAFLDVATKWNGALPALPGVVVLPSNLMDIITAQIKR